MGGGSGKTSYRDDIYVISDFSSGSGVSTSSGSRSLVTPYSLSATWNAVSRRSRTIRVRTERHSIRSGLLRWIIALNAKPSRHELVKSVTWTPGYLAVVRLAHLNNASRADTFGSWPTTISDIWKCKMIVQMRPRVSFGFPSTISSARIFTNLIFLYRKKSRAICTFCNMWNRKRPLSRGRCSPDSTSRREMRLCPSCKSTNRSPTCRLAFFKCLLTHLVNVFFWIASRSSLNLHRFSS